MVVGSRAQVMNGSADKTAGGLEKSDLKYKDGRIISKAQQAAAESNPGLKKWRMAVDKAKKKLHIPKAGVFVPITGKLEKEARKFFSKKK
jgi:hypothetical protein